MTRRAILFIAGTAAWLVGVVCGVPLLGVPPSPLVMVALGIGALVGMAAFAAGLW
jgi:hypothetical protein